MILLALNPGPSGLFLLNSPAYHVWKLCWSKELHQEPEKGHVSGESQELNSSPG